MTVYAEREEAATRHWASIVRQGIPEKRGFRVEKKFSGGSTDACRYLDEKIKADLSVVLLTEPFLGEILATVRLREQKKRKYDQFTLTAYHTGRRLGTTTRDVEAWLRNHDPEKECRKGQLFQGHAKVCLYGWQHDDEVIDTFLVDEEMLRVLVKRGELEPDAINIPGGHSYMDIAWGFNFAKLYKMNLILSPPRSEGPDLFSGNVSE